MRLLFVVALGLILSACGQSGGSDLTTGVSSYGAYSPIPQATPSPNKPLASLWLRADGNLTFDFTKLESKRPFIYRFAFNTGEQCACIGSINGDENVGSISTSNCQYQGGGRSDPTCSAFNNTYGGSDSYARTANGIDITLQFGGTTSAFH